MKKFACLFLVIALGCKDESTDLASVQTDVSLITTNDITNVTKTSATCGGINLEEKDSPVTERGVCWSLTFPPTITENKITAENGVGAFQVELKDLTPASRYYARAYFINAGGVVYDYTSKVFNTLGITSIGLATSEVTALTETSATSGGSFLKDNGVAITTRGVCWGTTNLPTIADAKSINGSGLAAYVAELTNLLPNTIYFVRAYATTPLGTFYGASIQFKTTGVSQALPVGTVEVVNVTNVAATCSGEINAAIDAATVTEKGFCWSTSPSPTVASNKLISTSPPSSPFTETITGLTMATTYYVKAYMIRNSQPTYGNEIKFNTKIADIENNLYDVVQIGTTTWMAANLRTTKYNDGTAIQNVMDQVAWETLTTAAWCAYNNTVDVNTINKYGLLYNWYAINNGNKNVCPAGWHIPIANEWNGFAASIGGLSVAGGKLKATTDWALPNTGANGALGFNAMPAGGRFISNGTGAGGFQGAEYFSYIWTTLNFSSETNYWGPRIDYNSELLNTNWVWDQKQGFSVRCKKD